MGSEKNAVSPMEAVEEADMPLLFEKEDKSRWTDTIDLPLYDIDRPVKEDYEEIFKEPTNYKDNIIGKYLGDICIRTVFRFIFDYTQAAVFYGVSLVVGAVASFFWAIVYALNQIMIVWLIQPWIKMIFTWLRLGAMPLRVFIRMTCDPFFQGVGQLFSFIRGRFRLDVSGLRLPEQQALTQL